MLQLSEGNDKCGILNIFFNKVSSYSKGHSLSGNIFKLSGSRMRKMVQSVQCLPHKHEDMTSDWHTHESQVTLVLKGRYSRTLRILWTASLADYEPESQ